jgi:hypothetical protein
MDENIKSAWVDALLSGRYEQGENYLNRQPVDGAPNKYCCLGVLCELAVAAGVVTSSSVERNAFEPPSVGYGADSINTVLPPEVQKWAGLDESNPALLGNYSASYLNDVLGMNFEQIAAVISAMP